NRFVAILDTRSAAEKAFLSSMLSLNNRLLAGAVVRNATRKAAMVEALRGAKDEARPLAKLLVASAIRRAGASLTPLRLAATRGHLGVVRALRQR
ncbi:unnamed protein product, partial [Polarella glacialis]